jgi:hypothetical protein
MFDGYVTVNPNAPSVTVVVARISIVIAPEPDWLAGLIFTEFAPVTGVAVGVAVGTPVGPAVAPEQAAISKWLHA